MLVNNSQTDACARGHLYTQTPDPRTQTPAGTRQIQQIRIRANTNAHVNMCTEIHRKLRRPLAQKTMHTHKLTKNLQHGTTQTQEAHTSPNIQTVHTTHNHATTDIPNIQTRVKTQIHTLKRRRTQWNTHVNTHTQVKTESISLCSLSLSPPPPPPPPCFLVPLTRQPTKHRQATAPPTTTATATAA